MAKEKQDNNPVIDKLYGVPIRNSNKLTIRVDEAYFRDLLEQAHRTSLSITKIMIIRSAPCQQCKCDNVTLSIKKVKHNYQIGNNGETLINKNGKGHDNTPEDINS